MHCFFSRQMWSLELPSRGSARHALDALKIRTIKQAVGRPEKPTAFLLQGPWRPFFPALNGFVVNNQQ
jgi:hypothetical protein